MFDYRYLLELSRKVVFTRVVNECKCQGGIDIVVYENLDIQVRKVFTTTPIDKTERYYVIGSSVEYRTLWQLLQHEQSILELAEKLITD